MATNTILVYPHSPDTLPIHSRTRIAFHGIDNPILALLHNRYMIRHAVTAPVKEHQRILQTVAPVIRKCPAYVAIPVVVSLPAELQPSHIRRALTPGLFHTVCIILYAHLDGIVRILNRTGAVGIPGIIRTLAGLHGIRSPPYFFP